MNLEESDSFKDEIESRDRKRRGVMITIVLCGIMVALLFILIMVISYQDSITEKFFIDGTQVTSTSFTSNLYVDVDGVTYINVKTLSDKLGYTYTKGQYQMYNENEDSCYLQNDFEIVTLTAGDTSYNKYIELSAGVTIADIEVTSKNSSGYSETYNMDNPILYSNGNLYVPLDNISKMFNLSLDWQQYRKKIYTLENRVASAQKAIASYKIVEMSGYYENLRAIIDGYVIVGDSETEGVKSTAYGVISLADGSEIISKKYDDVLYVQNVGEFYITAANGTMGILAADGSTIIAPSEFENISLLYEGIDSETNETIQLYLVQKGSEYGVVNRKGKVLIYAENDVIGLDESALDEYTLEELENVYVLFGKCIPVQKNGKYGLYNIDGTMVLNLQYEGFGYESTATSKTSGNEQSVLLIPSSVGINGIVVNLGDLYGIFDANTSELILPCVYEKIYAITKNGTTTYYADWNGEQYDLKELLEDRGLNNVDEDGNFISEDDEDDEDSSTNTTSSNTTNSTATQVVEVDDDSSDSESTDEETQDGEVDSGESTEDTQTTEEE